MNLNENYCMGKEITLDSERDVEDYAFLYRADIKSIITGKCVKKIGVSAFSDCLSLDKVVISETVKSIGDFAFCRCRLLTNITFNGTKKEWKGVIKGEEWKYGVPAKRVHCVDGDTDI